MKAKEQYIEATEDNYTHIKFIYDEHTIIVNKYTYELIYPDEKKIANSYQYLIKTT